MKKLILAVLSAFTFALPAAQAETAKTPVEPAAAAAVTKMLEVMKFREMTAMQFAQMDEGMSEMILNGIDSVIEADQRLKPAEKKAAHDAAVREVPAIVASLKQAFSDPALVDEMMAEIVPLYARHFTVAEIREMTAYYKTPIGKKMLEKMPAIMNESMQITQKMIMPRVSAAIGKFVQGQ